jgi:hypothetical protein
MKQFTLADHAIKHCGSEASQASATQLPSLNTSAVTVDYIPKYTQTNFSARALVVRFAAFGLSAVDFFYVGSSTDFQAAKLH